MEKEITNFAIGVAILGALTFVVAVIYDLIIHRKKDKKIIEECNQCFCEEC